jgi:hypothetical protein
MQREKWAHRGARCLVGSGREEGREEARHLAKEAWLSQALLGSVPTPWLMRWGPWP